MQYIYQFEEGNKEMIRSIGEKGVSLVEMTNLGLPIPKGFIIGSEICNEFLKTEEYPREFQQDLDKNLALLEEKVGKRFADETNPLLVSVRVGGAEPIPGLMDTILNLGLNDQTLQGLIKQTANPRFAYDTYHRFIFSFSTLVLGLSEQIFIDQINAVLSSRELSHTQDLSEADSKQLGELFKSLVLRETGEAFPEDPVQQLKLAMETAFKTWTSDEAILYRKVNGINDLAGCALTIQAMVFGNMGSSSGTGVMFTRDPKAGENQVKGEYMMQAQGKDINLRLRNSSPISNLKLEYPRLYEELIEAKTTLETHYKDILQFEFTIENGVLYLLQAKKARRSAKASVKIAVDLVKEGILTEKEALMNVKASSLEQFLHPRLEYSSANKVIAIGLPVAPGAACGKLMLSSQATVEAKERGEKIILIKEQITHEDKRAVEASSGVLTLSGGASSHAAVMANRLGKCCVSGCPDIEIDTKLLRLVTVDGLILHQGDIVTLDGRRGQLILGEVPVIEAESTQDLEQVMKWADKYRVLKVRANVNNLDEARTANSFAAEGIGLCRTEGMFFAPENLKLMRRWILSESTEEKDNLLAKMLISHRQEFMQLFTEMQGKPVTVRLLDPPLAKFFESYVSPIGENDSHILRKIAQLQEVNPLLGHRASRLAISDPSIYLMQTRAIIEAFIDCQSRGIEVAPEIALPLIGTFTEIKYLRDLLEEEQDKYAKAMKSPLNIGTIIELPRACLTAEEIAEYADFFTFATNDLSQTTYGFSRNDSSRFLGDYFGEGIITFDPASTLDEKGVGRLMRMAVQSGRSAKPDLAIGICGEHSNDPASIDFCHRIGLDYISCSPYSLLTARLAAAQAFIRNEIVV